MEPIPTTALIFFFFSRVNVKTLSSYLEMGGGLDGEEGIGRMDDGGGGGGRGGSC